MGDVYMAKLAEQARPPPPSHIHAHVAPIADQQTPKVRAGRPSERYEEMGEYMKKVAVASYS